MKILDLFAGIGGFSLAGHWLGWQTAAFVEWDGFCQKVLKKNFPNVPVYGDIKQFDGAQFKGSVDVISGGFPCQPFSTAGKRQGATDDRYLWPEMLRVIREVQPTWIVGENVTGILSMDGGAVFEEICASLESEGYAVQPFIIPACGKGAPHRRDRVWIVANMENRREWLRVDRAQDKGQEPEFGKGFVNGVVADAKSQQTQPTKPGGFHAESGGEVGNVANAESKRRNKRSGGAERIHADIRKSNQSAKPTPHSQRPGMERHAEHGKGRHESRRIDQEAPRHAEPCHWEYNWLQAATELCRMDDGFSSELDKLRNADRTNRLKALGNSIVPQIAYEIFKAIETQTP